MKSYFYRCVNDYCAAIIYEKENPEEDADVLAEELEASRCTNINAYSKECSANNFIVNWRTSTLCRE